MSQERPRGAEKRGAQSKASRAWNWSVRESDGP